MTHIAKIDSLSVSASDPIPTHPSLALWTDGPDGLLHRLRAEIAVRKAHPARTLVLLPYAQLMPLASRLWAQCFPDGFAPRFETTLNWSTSYQAVAPQATDLTFDMALDHLTACAMLRSAGLALQQETLAGLLVQATHQLAPLAAAYPPSERGEWAVLARSAALDAMDSPALATEAAIARIAVEWAALSGYASDLLFNADAMAALDCVLLVQGFAADGMLPALQRVWGDKVTGLALINAAALSGTNRVGVVAWHMCRDSEDEAQRAAACAITHISHGRIPVALVSTDRALTRRVQAMLDSAGVQMRDENGWKLSTSHAAAQLMAVLNAAAWNASCDSVLAWLKLAPAFALGVTELETALRRDQTNNWHSAAQGTAVLASSPGVQLIADANRVRAALQGSHTLVAWLAALRGALEACGMWEGLQTDDAGKLVLAALRLETKGLPAWERLVAQALWSTRRMDLAEFTSWVNQSLEGASFSPPYPEREQVVILPMSQMLARPFAALVLAGCDEVRLNPSPEPPGNWNASLRAALGLPSRDDLQNTIHAAWQSALQTPMCDVLWRSSDDAGETLLPSALVQKTQLDGGGAAFAADPRTPRLVPCQPVLPPVATGELLAVRSLSASAYDDLRTCPYRFFALRQMGLHSVDELDAGVDKRDFGVWLHAVLTRFHESAALQVPVDSAARTVLLDTCSVETTQAMGLGEGEFLPFAAAWPAVRDGYLRWLGQHEATGATFATAEASHSQRLGDVRLVGRIDRIDRLADGSALVLDYKTENAGTTASRVKEPLEDTQIAFYAALLPHDTLHGAYVNVGERDGTRAYPQPDIELARDVLLDGIQMDMAHIRQGAVLPALGEGSACDFCHARGLCRKDFWI